MKERIRELTDLLDKIKEKKNDLKVEEAVLEKEKKSIQESLAKLGVTADSLEGTIKQLEKEIAEGLESIKVPKEFL